MEHLQQWLSGELELSWAGRGSPQPYPSTAARLLPPLPLSCHRLSSERWLHWRAGYAGLLPHPAVHTPAQVLMRAHLGRAMSEAKKPSSHSPSSSQC